MSETETRPRHLTLYPRRDRDETFLQNLRDETRPRRFKNRSRDRLETETSRPRLHPSGGNPVFRYPVYSVYLVFYELGTFTFT
jgi:hypothetical protein